MMKLRRKLSGVLHSKKPDRDPTFPINRLSSIDEVDINSSVSTDLDASQLQEALLDSMHDEHRTLKRDLVNKDNEIALLQQQLYQNQRQPDLGANLLDIIATLRQELSDTVAGMTRERNTRVAEHERQLAEHRRQATEHLTTIQEYQDIAASMTHDNSRLQEQLMALQLENAELAHLKVRSQAEAVQDRLLARDEMQADQRQLVERVRTLEAELDEVKTDAARKAEEYALAGNTRRTSTWGGADATPRSILASKLLTKGFQATTATDRPEVTLFLRSCSITTLTNQSLDVRLEQPQAQQFADGIGDTDGSLSFLKCSICNLHKITRADEASHLSSRIDEFPSRVTLCCSQSICTTCYLAGVVSSLYGDWWTKIEERNWIICPAPNCNSAVIFQGRLKDLLRQLGDGKIRAHIESHKHISALRTAFRRLNIGNDTLAMARRMHWRLFDLGKMHELFNEETHRPMPSHNHDLPVLAPGNVKMLRVDHGEGSLQVPYLVDYLRRRPARECIVCTEELADVDIGSPEAWLSSLGSDFPGTWMWNVLLFPVRLGLPCRHESGFCRQGDLSICQGDSACCGHEMNICTGCLQQHLESQLEQHGSACRDRLTCPECRRVLDYDEIKLYAKDETFQTYDKYLNLDYLSKDPTFRWCLRAGCTSGALYEETDDPRIQCDECAFEMCREHGEPWHEGLTCEQHDSIKAHGDPDFQRTTDWIAQNTKPCPRCNRSIQKGEACFHMTCSQCRAEFCWVCLADYADIIPSPGEHNAEAHGAGCPFRTNGLTPSQLIGEDIAEARRW